MPVLIHLAIMILSGMLMGRLVKYFKLPNVTGYLIAGLLIGPSVLHFVPSSTLSDIIVLSEVALGFIAFTIGNEFKFSYFKRVGTAPIMIAFFEALLAVLFVFVGLLLLGQDLRFSLVLSAIAAATAPAATIMVIKQYKAKGPVTETLLSVVAIDDAMALILFGIAVALAQALEGIQGVGTTHLLLKPIIEILGALGLGCVLGLTFSIFMRWFKKDGNRLALTLSFVFAGIGLANMLGLSALLLCMSMGATLTNLTKETKHIAKLADAFTPPLFILFFVASGAELQLAALPSVGLVGVTYIIMRVLGKIVGASLGALISRADTNVCKYLGPALIPQAGVAIGLSLAAESTLPEYGSSIRTIILCATLIYELIGPAITKATLTKAGEISIIDQKNRTKKGKDIKMNTITVEKRNPDTKAKKLRRSGIIPCVVYGGKLEESLSIQISQHTANKLFRLYREGSKVQLKVDDQLIPVQIKDKSQDPLTNTIIHISFEALQADQKVNSVAHILLQNTDKIKGILEKMLLEIPYASLPDHMIDTVSIDLDGMPVGTILTVEDIPAFKDENVELQVDKDSIVLRIADKKRAPSESESEEAIA